MKKIFAVAIILWLSSCSGLRIKDFNKVSAGMSQEQVISALGEPGVKKMTDGKEIFQYELKDENGESRPRIVVFKDREVVFYGKPSEYKSEQQSSTPNSASVQNHNTNTNTINPAITIGATNVTVNPVITVVPIEADATQNKRIPSSGSNYFHSVPTADEHHNSTQEGQ